MSYRLVNRALDTDAGPSERLVLVVLAEKANDAGWQCWPSVATICRRSGLSERTVQRCIDALTKGGHLTPHRRKGASTQYHVHPRHYDTPNPRHYDTPANVTPPSYATKTPVTMTPEPLEPSLEDIAEAISKPIEVFGPETLLFIEAMIERSEKTKAKAKSKPRPNAKKAEPIELPDWMPVRAWDGFIDMRKDKKAAPTNYAIELLIAKLDKWRCEGAEPAMILDQSTLNKWTDLYPIKENHNAPRTRNTPSQPTNPYVIASLEREAERAAGIVE